jgi:site-specific DNA-cytosine methylase
MDGGTTTERVYTVLFAFSGIGGGALGFQRAEAEFRKLGVRARFRVLGGIEFDESTARDFERLTGAPCLVADVSALTPERLREVFGQVPDVVVFSPPCKPASGLLAEAIAQTEKYRTMALLGAVFVDLMFAAWPRGPRLLLMENVPRITTRAPEMMKRIRAACRAHRFHIHEEAHDLGELGALAQHRDRLLFVGRRDDVPTLLYKPVRRKLRTIGEVLGKLPLPGDPKAGRLHQLPAISALTALRLALIPAGGDWRDLPSKVHVHPSFAALLGKSRGPSNRTPFNDVWRVVRWDSPAPCVTAGSGPSAGGLCVADPRLSAVDPRTLKPSHPHTYGVLPWDKAAHTVTGNTYPGGGPFSVADPRITCKTRENSGIYGVLPWGEPCGTIVGHACHDNGRFSVADQRITEYLARCPFPVIFSVDGTLHRPLTTLECAALQSFDAFDDDGAPFDLDGSQGACRVKIGDAMPPAATEAMAVQVLLTLAHADAGVFALSGGGAVWVREREMQRAEVQ